MRSGLLFSLLALLLAGGLIQILRLRVQSNDLLPAYSSLSTGPKGLSVLFESLDATGSVALTRSNQPPSQIRNGDATLVFAGVDLFMSPNADSTSAELEALARKGNRVLASLNRGPSRFQKSQKVWGVSLAAALAANSDDDDGDDEEAAHWPAYFQAGSDWRVLYSVKDRAVVIERNFDSGSIVLLAATWPLTNEAMVQDRQSGLLAGLFSPHPRVIFDESHLGMEESGTVMALSRRFRLQGFLMGLVVLACLFVWRNLAGFPPDRSLPVRRVGRDSLTGLSILLARNVPENILIETCLAQRQKSGGNRLENTGGSTVERFEAIRRELHAKTNL